MIENINDLKIRQIQTSSPVLSPAKQNTKKSGFGDIMARTIEESKELHFSKHSKERIAQRGIEMTDTLLTRLNTAADSARQKGARDVVMIGPDAAFIVNIPNNVVVTAINGSELKSNVFTNIDSAVLL